MSVNFSKLSEDTQALVATSRFFRNEKVTPEKLLRAGQQQLRARLEGEGVRSVLVFQDTTEINFGQLPKQFRDTQGLGLVGNNRDTGVFLHAGWVVDAESHAPLGLVDLQHWARSEEGLSSHRRSREMADKESIKWLSVAKACQAQLPPEVHRLLISDRESDIYSYLAAVQQPGQDALVRLRGDRKIAAAHWLTGNAGEEVSANGRDVLLQALEIAPELGRFRTTLFPHRPQMRVAELALRAGRVELIRPHSADAQTPKIQQVWVVQVTELHPPDGIQPVAWTLLTTQPILDFAAAQKMVENYRARWMIEQFFRLLKSEGLQVEHSQVHSGHCLLNVLYMACLVASKALALRYVADNQLAKSWFSKEEIQFMLALVLVLEGKTEKQKNPYPPESLKWAAWIIARLGGWKGYASQRRPGPITFADGLAKFYTRFEGWLMAKSIFNTTNV